MGLSSTSKSQKTRLLTRPKIDQSDGHFFWAEKCGTVEAKE